MAAAVVLLAVLVGCSGRSPNGVAGAAGEATEPGVWVSAASGGAVMIHVASDEPDLTGTLDQVELSGPGQTEIETTHASFTGTVDGSSVVLTFPLGLGFMTSLSGSLSAGSMTLNLPQDSGIIATVTLTPSSRAAYNRAVEAVRSQAATNSRARASAAAVDAERSVRAAAEQKITDAASRVMDTVTRLSAATAAGPGFTGFEAALAAAKKAVAEARRYADQAAGEADEYTACSRAYSARSAAYSADTAGYSGDSAADTVAFKIRELNDLVAAVNRARIDYATALSQLSGYTPANPPDDRAIQKAVAAASGQTSAWKAKSDDYQRKIADEIKQATAIADKAEQQYC